MEYQIRNWLYFTWLSGDHINEQAIHSLDKTAWLQGDEHPVRAFGTGGRQQRTGREFGDIYDHHTVFYEYPSGVRVNFMCRQQQNCDSYVDEIVRGTKGQARILGQRNRRRESVAVRPESRRRKSTCTTWSTSHCSSSIREGKPINNGHYMANSTMLAIMGRMCTYTGQALTWDECMNSQERLGPKEYGWHDDVPEGKVAIPGKTKLV